MKRTLFALSAMLLLAGCGAKKDNLKPVNTKQLSEKSRKGYPDWVNNPYTKDFDPSNSICSYGQSNLGLSTNNVDAARNDAEIQVKNRIAEQLQAEVGLLQERNNQVFRDVSNGKEVGELSLKVINQNFQQTKLTGLRWLSTQHYPDPMKPEMVFVLGCIRVDFIELAKNIQDQMVSAAKTKQQLEYDHEKAMLRFDEVRKQYLGEKGLSRPAGQ